MARLGMALALLFSVVSGSVAASAGAEAVRAQIATPLATLKRPIAGGAVFLCEQSQCVAQSPTGRTYSARACRELARAAGRISSFEKGDAKFSPDQLDRCNRDQPADPL